VYKIPANTLFTGKKLVFVPECHSTNSLALELTQKRDLAEGTIVITNHQIQGRGQQGNVWISEQGKNLTFSLVIKPAFLPIKDQFLLNMAMSLGIRDFVQEQVVQSVNVKWPNDIIVGDKKICGILIENQIQGSSFSNSIVGIGLNVNQKAFYSGNAISLAMLTSTDYQLQEVFEMLCGNLEKWYMLLKQNRMDVIKQAYLACLYGINEIRSFRTMQEHFDGKIEGVDDTGRLMINAKEGIRYFNTKEVQFDFEPLK